MERLTDCGIATKRMSLMDYPSGTTEWLKYFGQPSEDNQVLDEQEIMRLKRKDEHKERQRFLKEERSWTRK